MTKPGDLPTNKKTIQELTKEFPDKTYRELEIYRDKYNAVIEAEIKLKKTRESGL
mgnify:CR=1 FL=1